MVKLNLLKILPFVSMLTKINTFFIKNDIDFVELELKIFLGHLKSCHQFDVYNTCLYTSFNTEVNEEIKKLFIKENMGCVSIVTNNLNIINNHNIHHFIVFLKSQEDIMETMDQIFESPSWDSTKYIYFIITTRVTDYSFLSRNLQHTWSKNVAKFVLVFVHNKYEVYTFHPFTENTTFNVNQNGRFCENLQLNKMKNFYGKPLRSLLYKKPPYGFMRNGVWTGIDVKIMYLVADMINATVDLKTFPTIHECMNGLMKKEYDVIFIRVFKTINDGANVTHSYPYAMIDKIAVVPKPSRMPPYQCILYIFDLKTWTTLLLAIVVLIAYNALETRSTSFLNHFLVTWCPLLNVSIPNSLMTLTKKKWLIMLWIYMALILNTSFQSAMLTSLITPMYQKGIKTIDELLESDLKLYISPLFRRLGYSPANMYIDLDRFEELHHQKTIELLNKKDKSGAHIISRELAKYVIRNVEQKYGEPIYETIDETVIPGMAVYILQRKSPLLETIHQSLLLIKQHGFGFEAVPEEYFKGKTLRDGNVLSLSHILVAIYLLVLGYFVGTVVLMMEIILKKLGI